MDKQTQIDKANQLLGLLGRQASVKNDIQDGVSMPFFELCGVLAVQHDSEEDAPEDKWFVVNADGNNGISFKACHADDIFVQPETGKVFISVMAQPE